MSCVFVVDANRTPLDPVHPGRARWLLKQKKAAILRRYPFTILLKTEHTDEPGQLLRLKIDPGSKTTGIAVVNDTTGQVVFAAEVHHRGQVIKKRLDDRRGVRRSRRQRKTRYRPARWANRRKKEGWLAPSIESRIHNVITWVNRIRRWCPIGAISQELVKFDLQKMEHPEITGREYQQGTLYGYELREYLLQKWQRRCSYCQQENVPLQVEHIVPRAKGGTNRASNVCLACDACNKAKGTQDLAVFLAKKPDLLKKIQAQAKAPLKDAAAVNATRWHLYQRLKATGLPIECGSGGLTKYNRTQRGLEKTHWLDSCCVGMSTPKLLGTTHVRPLFIQAMGHGSRQMCVTDATGFPKQHKARCKHSFGYQTGDIVKAIIPKGKYRGTYEGRIIIRHRPSFRLGTFDVHPQYLRCIHRADGFRYAQKGDGNSSHP
ncbi:RNA-guided endonuclease IscB [Tengunoibacter tsumagoiensis]|uniref:HNH nuclease domain-containing protein n=1 Tax=Tengunoibacter tsumagoiensis TaxID=2014871 RepID=A0A401ZVY7_9CHLR|nr:RNA-guided endonuclease IscB [Tengunoibacter tsumagoiensis]GCE11007.1 hypothetical protein KTT_08660 [Tengunoibacter tsumagoiensis]